MPNIHDVQDWFGSLSESYAFVIAVPVVVGVTLASIAEWAEHNWNAAAATPSRGYRATSLRPAAMTQDR
jgi:hypothetical protein